MTMNTEQHPEAHQHRIVNTGVVARTEVDRAFATRKLEEYIHQGIKKAQNVYEMIQSTVVEDDFFHAKDLAGRVSFDDTNLMIDAGSRNLSVHANALQQMAGKTGIPWAYAQHLREVEGATPEERDVERKWKGCLLAHTLKEHFQRREESYLLRSTKVAGVHAQEMRGFLSDKYRIIDCRPTARELVKVSQEVDAVITDGIFTPTRSSLKIILPRVLEPTPGEFLVFGLDWSNSDFGHGANGLRAFMLRLVCWNGAVLETSVKQIHLGTRLSSDVVYSREALNADAGASALAFRDTARYLLSDQRLGLLEAVVKGAACDEIDARAKLADLKKKGVTKSHRDAIAEAFNGPDVAMMPPGNTAWRWSNAISYVAGQTEEPDAKIDLERLAGDVLKKYDLTPKAPVAAR